jgi:PAS domain S-box-containing protein
MGGLRVSIPKEKGACERLNNSTTFKLFDLMSEGVILQDENGAIVYYNSSADKIFNIEKNKGIQNAFPESKQLGFEILKDGKKRSNIEIKVINQNGEIAWIRLNAIALSNLDSGKTNLVLNTFNEITETQKTLNDLKQIEIIFNNQLLNFMDHIKL